jgi:hypothetical protein
LYSATSQVDHLLEVHYFPELSNFKPEFSFHRPKLLPKILGGQLRVVYFPNPKVFALGVSFCTVSSEVLTKFSLKKLTLDRKSVKILHN